MQVVDLNGLQLPRLRRVLVRYQPESKALAPTRCPSPDFSIASSMSKKSMRKAFRRSVQYGFGCLGTALLFRLAKWGFVRNPKFPGKAASMDASRQ